MVSPKIITLVIITKKIAFKIPTKKHLSDSLKIFHLNIESFKANSRELSSYLKCLSFKFDIICLTEIRKTSVGIINKEFPEFDINILIPSQKYVRGMIKHFNATK